MPDPGLQNSEFSVYRLDTFHYNFPTPFCYYPVVIIFSSICSRLAQNYEF